MILDVITDCAIAAMLRGAMNSSCSFTMESNCWTLLMSYSKFVLVLLATNRILFRINLIPNPMQYQPHLCHLYQFHLNHQYQPHLSHQYQIASSQLPVSTNLTSANCTSLTSQPPHLSHHTSLTSATCTSLISATGTSLTLATTQPPVPASSQPPVPASPQPPVPASSHSHLSYQTHISVTYTLMQHHNLFSCIDNKI